jgi:hypothetical protein
MERKAARHSSALAARVAGVRSEDYWDHQPGDRVMTSDGFPGRVTAVLDGPVPGWEEYQVTLDGGLGGGAYVAGQLRAMSSAPATASEHHTADQDYPELGSILTDRPDPGLHPESLSRTATTINGQEIDRHGDAPHEVRAAEPNSYDSESTEGAGDEEFNSPLRESDQRKYDQATAASNAPPGGAAVSGIPPSLGIRMTEELGFLVEAAGTPFYPEQGSESVRAHMQRHHGPVDPSIPDDELAYVHMDAHDPMSESYDHPGHTHHAEAEPAAMAPSASPVPGGIHWPSYHEIPPFERGPDPLQTKDFHPLEQAHFSALGRMDERMAERHLQEKHGWTPSRIERTAQVGDLLSDHHVALHDTGMVSHSHDDAPSPDPGWASRMAGLVAEAAVDHEARFEVTATWRDVLAKATRIRAGGGVHIALASDTMVIGDVRGDHHVYETGIQRMPGGPSRIGSWACGCKWASYHQAARRARSYAGRPCSHVMALHLEAQSRGIGRALGPAGGQDRRKPKWVPSKVVVKWDIDEGRNELARSAAASRSLADELASALLAQGESRRAVGLMFSCAGIRLTAAANDPFGGSNTMVETPAKPYGATSPANKSESPASTGFLSAPDPTNWGSIESFPSANTTPHSGAVLQPPLQQDQGRPEEPGNPYVHEGHVGGPFDAMAPGDPSGMSSTSAWHYAMEIGSMDDGGAGHDPVDVTNGAQLDTATLNDRPEGALPSTDGSLSLVDALWHMADLGTPAGTPDAQGDQMDSSPATGNPVGLQTDNQNLSAADPEPIAPTGNSYQPMASPGMTPQSMSLPPTIASDGGYPGSEFGGPGVGGDDESLSPDDDSIQTMGLARPDLYPGRRPTAAVQESGGNEEISDLDPGDLLGDGTGGTGQQMSLGARAAAVVPEIAFRDSATTDGDIAQAARAQLRKMGMDTFSDAEARQLIDEGRGTRAANLDRLDIKGTHFADLEDKFAQAGLDPDDDVVWL